ncbi:MAG: UvrD-helicase domain-containing protein [Caldilineaceae bacterium]|nr:UvrD-helicase domain-containing protein [Caldilineaceae bacterium]
MSAPPRTPSPANGVAAGIEPAPRVRRVAEAAPGPWAQVDLFGKDKPANGASHPLLRGLNDEQRAAVLCLNAPVIIAAGPGTGKTRTLTHRIAYLVDAHGVNPESVLAITFTNKAAGEMAARLGALLPPETAGAITVKTFHALGAQLLQLHHERAGLPPTFAILDDEARLRVLRGAVPDLTAAQAARVLDAIAAAKNQMQTPDAPELATHFAPELGADLVYAYRLYEGALAAAGAVDFDDLMLRTVLLLERCPDVLQTVTARFRWISVDEYQDVNAAQYRLLQLLTVGGANLCAIGDPDQAIYGFRGADRRYFFRFADDYAGARILQLSQNYRSVQSILDAAQQVIDKNPDREALRIWSEFVAQTRLDLYQAPTDKAEAEYVVHQIEQMVGGTSYFSLDSGRVLDDGQGRGFGDFAVLYRTGAQSALLVEAFERSGIPYQVVGRSSLFAHADVQRLMAHLWLLYVPWSRVHWETLLHAHTDVLAADALDAFIAALRAGNTPDAALATQDVGWNRPTRAYLDAVLHVQRTLVDHAPDATVEELLTQVLDAYTGDDALALALDDEQRGRLLRRARLHAANLPAFLEAAALARDIDSYDSRADRVTLMTLHASKGLEFPVVFMVGCEEGLLPYVRVGTEPKDAEPDVEEERRLFYVGMTRAQEKLILTHARSRFLFGRRVEAPVSRFVNDIATSLKELRRAAPRKPVGAGPDHVQLTLF